VLPQDGQVTARASCLLVIGADRAEPRLELVTFFAGERVADHDASLLARSTPSPAISISNSRPCLIAGNARPSLLRSGEVEIGKDHAGLLACLGKNLAPGETMML
jgi:hypothetical protein